MLQHTETKRRKAILLVDDDAGVRAAIAQAFHRSDLILLEADGPQRAVQLWNSNKEDIVLILMDVMLPGLSGPELARELLELDPKAPIVFITGVGEPYLKKFNVPEDRQVLHKPFPLQELRSVLDNALKDDQSV